MNAELQRVRELRPEVAPPTAHARQAALQRLMAVIEDEPPGLHAHRAPRPRQPARRGPFKRARQFVPSLRLGALVPVGVVAVAAAVLVGALVLLGHHASRTPVGSASGAGRLEAAGGGVLIGPHAHAGLPAVIAEGLRREYRTQLRAGKTIHTSINLPLERAAERSLRHSIAVNHGSGGAFVALDPHTGAVEAIGSATVGDATRGLDRAVSAAGSTGGAFTPITALAAMRAGVWSPQETYKDTGKFCLASRNPCYRNAGNAAYGALTLSHALAVDSGTFFDNLGARLNSNAPNGGALQAWARRLGLGSPTGIDMPDETAGLLPTPKALRELHPPIRWSEADNINLAVGQGDLAVSPIQLAVAYAAISNGGTILVPHLATPGSAAAATVRGRLQLPAADLAAIRAGLRGSAAGLPGETGTTQRVFGSLAEPVAGAPGSTQTISHGHEVTNGWYAGYLTSSTHSRPLIVVVLVQHAGFGAVTAAPVARQILSQWTTGHPGPFIPGTSVAQ
jgi:penicillin-binding protein 2